MNLLQRVLALFALQIDSKEMRGNLGTPSRKYSKPIDVNNLGMSWSRLVAVALSDWEEWELRQCLALLTSAHLQATHEVP